MICHLYWLSTTIVDFPPDPHHYYNRFKFSSLTVLNLSTVHACPCGVSCDVVVGAVVIVGHSCVVDAAG